MNHNAITSSREPTEAEIQHTAYMLWLESGREPGRDVEHWLAAKELLRHHHAPAAGHKRGVVSSVPPAIPSGPAPKVRARTNGTAH